MISALLIICGRCDAREPLGGNPEARLRFLIASGWHYEARGVNYCPHCWRLMQNERKPMGAI
jgi:hypothetical protein